MPDEIKARRYLDRFDSAGRKRVPMFTGFVDYFPDAVAAVAEHSFKGNDKHNPGQPLHHARGKSMDHTDCILRHASNYDGMDGDALEVVALAWRAMALAQEVLERKYGLTLPRGVVDPRAFPETNSLVGPNGEQAPAEMLTLVAESPDLRSKIEERDRTIDRLVADDLVPVTARAELETRMNKTISLRPRKHESQG